MTKADKAKEPARSNVRTMLLPVTLSAAEVMVRAKELAGTIKELSETQDRLEAHTEAAKTTKRGIEDEIDVLSKQCRMTGRVVSSGREDRDVEVYDELDYGKASVYTKRADTEEIVGTRGMTEHERQRSLWPKDKTPDKEPPAGDGGEVPPTIQ